MSIFIIKIIACVTMVLDHVKYAIPLTECFATKYLGRIAFPLFAFLVGEGYSHTRDLKRYYKRLIIFALISQIPFMLFRTLVGEWKMLNIMFTLLFGLFAITAFDKIDKKIISIPIVIIMIFLGRIFRVDYGWYGVACVFVLYICRNKKIARILGFITLNLIFYYKKLFVNYSTAHLISFICATIPVFLLLFYNGKLGKKTAFFYYIFYPVHMLILYLSNFLIY